MASVPPSVPKPTPEHKKVRLSAEDEADLRAGIEEAERGEGVVLTPEQVKRWAETGEMPWLDSPSSPRNS